MIFKILEIISIELKEKEKYIQKYYGREMFLSFAFILNCSLKK